MCDDLFGTIIIAMFLVPFFQVSHVYISTTEYIPWVRSRVARIIHLQAHHMLLLLKGLDASETALSLPVLYISDSMTRSPCPPLATYTSEHSTLDCSTMGQ